MNLGKLVISVSSVQVIEVFSSRRLGFGADTLRRLAPRSRINSDWVSGSTDVTCALFVVIEHRQRTFGSAGCAPLLLQGWYALRRGILRFYDRAKRVGVADLQRLTARCAFFAIRRALCSLASDAGMTPSAPRARQRTHPFGPAAFAAANTCRLHKFVARPAPTTAAHTSLKRPLWSNWPSAGAR